MNWECHLQSGTSRRASGSLRGFQTSAQYMHRRTTGHVPMFLMQLRMSGHKVSGIEGLVDAQGDGRGARLALQNSQSAPPYVPIRDNSTARAAAALSMAPHPQWRPQKRVEESQPLRQWHGQDVGLVCQLDTQLCQLITPAAAEKKGREAAAGRPESHFVWIVLAVACGHRLHRGRL